MTVIKRNQVVALSVAVMIIAAGYLNYTFKGKEPFSQELTGNMGEKFTSERLGDATLVEQTEDVEIGQASPVSSSSVVPKDNSTQVPKQQINAASNSAVSQETFFDEARMERERVRDEETEIFEKIISSETSTTESQAKAQNKLTELSQKWEKEMIIEKLIKAKGFQDVIVFINDNSVNVIVLNNSQITNAQAAQIKDIVVRETKIPIENIKIVVK
ncbi:MAG: SpoIIIAH-like family protein [Ignavibacteriales bacterium]